MRDIRQTEKYANYMRSTGWIVENSKGVFYYIKKIPLFGSILKAQRPEAMRHIDITNIAKRHKVFKIILEPKNKLDAKILTKMGYNLSKNPFLPPKTLHLDITKNKAGLLQNMKKDARRSIEKPLDNRYKITKTKNLNDFRKGWKKTGSIKTYVPSLKHLQIFKNIYKDECLFLIYKNNITGKIVSGAVFLMGNKIGYYWWAFTGKDGRKLNAQYKLVWEGVLWAKFKKAKVFDFEGVYDSRFPKNSWRGFTHFKKSFGGIEMEYPGTYIKHKLPWR